VLTGHAKPIHAVAFSPDGCLLVTAAADGTVRLWLGDAREPLLIVRYPRARSFDGLAVSRNGAWVAALAQSYIHIWGSGPKP
jgi:WD40 repeat protein